MNAKLIQGGSEVPAPQDLAQLCLDAWTLARDIESLEQDLKAKKQAISEALDFEGTVLIPGTCRVNVTERRAISVANAEALRAALKDRFGELVVERVTFTPTDNLKGIALSATDPLHKSVVRWLKIAKSYPVTMEADKPSGEAA